jgi:ABC-2 type transport system permease protein
MKNIIHLMKKEFLQTIRERKMIGSIFIAPIIQLFMLGYAANLDIKEISLVVCDKERSQKSVDFISQFTNSGYFQITGYANNSNEIEELISNGKSVLGLVIPNDFSKKILANNSTYIQIYVDGSDANAANIALGYTKQITSSYSNVIMTENIKKSGRNLNIARVLPEPRVWYNPDLKSSNYMIPGVLALILMIITSTMSSLGIVREKEIGTLEQLIVTPIKRYEFILGKLLPFALFGIIDMIIVLTLAQFWFDVPLRGNIITLYVLSGLYLLTTLGLGLMVSTFSKTQQQAMMTSMFFVIMPFMFLSGFAFPIDNMPPIIQFISNVVPLKYYLIIVRGIFLKGNTLLELWKETVTLIFFGIFILSISIKRFNKKLDW